MKVLILYSSLYRGHTKKIAEAFSMEADCDLMDASDKVKPDLDIYDLVGFGTGIYRETGSPLLQKRIGEMDLKGRNVFVFSTSGVGMTFYNREMLRLLEEKGAIVKGSFACLGSYAAKEFTQVRMFHFLSKFAEGHPDERDLKRAQKYIRKLMIKNNENRLKY